MASTRKMLTSLHGRKVGLAKDGNLVIAGRTAVASNDGGAQFSTQGAPTAFNTTGTLTIANLQTGIITSTVGAAVNATLPTGTLMESGDVMSIGDSFAWSVISTGAFDFTLVAATGHTIVGTASVSGTLAARFLSRKTAANTFITYRLS